MDTDQASPVVGSHFGISGSSRSPGIPLQVASVRHHDQRPGQLCHLVHYKWRPSDIMINVLVSFAIWYVVFLVVAWLITQAIALFGHAPSS
jgi:hypothetical protein